MISEFQDRKHNGPIEYEDICINCGKIRGEHLKVLGHPDAAIKVIAIDTITYYICPTALFIREVK